MSMHPLTWFNPSRIGGEAAQLLSRTVTLATVVVDRLAADVDGDVDGEQPKEVVALSYRGVEYEFDLTEKDATGLDRVLAPYLANARRVTAQRRNTRRPAVASSVSQDPRAVRLGEDARHRDRGPGTGQRRRDASVPKSSRRLAQHTRGHLTLTRNANVGPRIGRSSVEARGLAVCGGPRPGRGRQTAGGSS